MHRVGGQRRTRTQPRTCALRLGCALWNAIGQGRLLQVQDHRRGHKGQSRRRGGARGGTGGGHGRRQRRDRCRGDAGRGGKLVKAHRRRACSKPATAAPVPGPRAACSDPLSSQYCEGRHAHHEVPPPPPPPPGGKDYLDEQRPRRAPNCSRPSIALGSAHPRSRPG